MYEESDALTARVVKTSSRFRCACPTGPQRKLIDRGYKLDGVRRRAVMANAKPANKLSTAAAGSGTAPDSPAPLPLPLATLPKFAFHWLYWSSSIVPPIGLFGRTLLVPTFFFQTT